MAKQLYDYWFVQFDFPNEDDVPYKSYGGTLRIDADTKLMIPETWSAISINELCSSSRGVSYDKDDLLEDGSGVLVLRGNNIQDNKLVYDSNTAYVPESFVADEQRIEKHDIVMTMSSGSKEHIGKSIMFQKSSTHTYGAFLTKFRPRKDYAHYVFLFFCSKYFKAKIKSVCNGTGINNLTNQTFNNIFIPIPPKRTLMSFNDIVSPIFDQIGELELQQFELEKQRDTLLPLLMNGQVSVTQLNSDLALSLYITVCIKNRLLCRNQLFRQ